MPTPLEIWGSSCVFYAEFGDASTVSVVDGLIAAITDKASGNTYTQPTAGSRMAYQPTGYGGGGAALMASGKTITFPQPANFPSGNSPHTIIIVGRYTASNAYPTPFAYGGRSPRAFRSMSARNRRVNAGFFGDDHESNALGWANVERMVVSMVDGASPVNSWLYNAPNASEMKTLAGPLVTPTSSTVEINRTADSFDGPVRAIIVIARMSTLDELTAGYSYFSQPYSAGGTTVGGTGTAAGTGAALAAGSSQATGTGSTTGTGAAVAAGTATAAALGSAAGAGTATGAGSALSGGAGSAVGTGTAQATGTARTSTTGTATGVGTAQATGSALVSGTGVAAGGSTATGTSGSQVVIGATGTSLGGSTVLATGQALASGTGTAAGSSTAASTSGQVTGGTGSAAGTASVSASGAARVSGQGAAQGSAVAAAVATSRVGVLGVAVGTGRAFAYGTRLQILARPPASRTARSVVRYRVAVDPVRGRRAR